MKQGFLKMDDEGNIFEWAKPPEQSLLRVVAGIKFATRRVDCLPDEDLRGEERHTESPDRNSRRPPCIFAGSVDSLNSIHRAAELRIIQLRVFSSSIYIDLEETSLSQLLNFRTMHYLAPIVRDDARAFYRVSYRKLSIINTASKIDGLEWI